MQPNHTTMTKGKLNKDSTSMPAANLSYTLQPVPLNLSETEFRAAQRALFDKTAQMPNLMALKTKEWAILGVLLVIAIVGIIFVSGYSTLLFWLILAAIAAYLLMRTVGLKWYMRQEYEKQVAATKMPPEFAQMHVGVSKNGLIISLPAPEEALSPAEKAALAASKNRRRTPLLQMQTAVQQALIGWQNVTSWDETERFLFVLFTANGQQGSQIIPKSNTKLPITTIKTHLANQMPQGLKPEQITSN